MNKNKEKHTGVSITMPENVNVEFLPANNFRMFQFSVCTLPIVTGIASHLTTQYMSDGHQAFLSSALFFWILAVGLAAFAIFATKK